jgi:hypothetical protein
MVAKASITARCGCIACLWSEVMKKAHRCVLASISIVVLSACGKGEVTPAAEHDHARRAVAAASPSTETVGEASGTDPHPTSIPRLAGEIVDPDADRPIVSDEDAVIDSDVPADAEVLEAMPTEVTLQSTETTSLRASAARSELSRDVARHNAEARERTSLGLSATQAATVAPKRPIPPPSDDNG